MTIELPSRAQELLSGTAPEPLRRGIAAGAIPMEPLELVSCLAVMVAKDPVEELRNRARATLAELPANVRQAALTAPLAPPVFRVLVKHIDLSDSDRERLVLNSAAPDDVLTDLVRKEHNSDILEIVAGNQTRMLRHVPLVEALLENNALGPASKSRVEEFFARAYAGKLLLQTGHATAEDLKSQGWDDAEVAQLQSAAPDEATAAAVPDDLLVPDEPEVVDEEEAADLIAAAAGDEKATQTKAAKMANLRRAVATMTVPEKIKLAMLGGKEARSLLIFDANKIISALVLKNPRISEKEVVAIASSKTAREDILRAVARDRKFIKSYSVKKALVENPKTPPQLALQMLTQMRDADLQKIARSRSVSGNVAQQAKRMLLKKQQDKQKK